MSDPNAKSGPLTQADLQAIWESAVDEGFSQPFIEAGEGHGFEAYTSGFAIYARVSQAIDITTQAMFVKPWSGQSNASAQGGKLATVTLTFTRTAFIERPLRLQAGLIFVQEQQTDWGDGGGVSVLTGRRYVLTQDVVFLPGEKGPFNVVAVAEKVGYGYNNPLPNTISAITQLGSGFNNIDASVATSAGTSPPPPNAVVQIITIDEADMFIPEHAGQYVLLTAGSNNGLYGRVVQYLPPNPPLQGTSVVLEVLCAIRTTAITGTFQLGEPITIKNGGTVVGYGTFLASRPDGNGNQRVGFVLLQGTFVNGYTLNGKLSTATCTIAQTLYFPQFVSETLTASWRVLDWALDFGLVVTHTLSPSGGLSPMLDELGNEKNLPRGSGETDVSYSYRQSKIADVVSPNAIKRTLNKTLGNIPWCFREVGLSLLPGFFYDRVGDVHGDFWDFDTITFTGTITSGAFVDPVYFQEKVEFRDATNKVKARGFFGRITGGTTFTFIRRDGQGSLANPAVFAAGDYIIGLSSKAIFTLATVVTTPFVAPFRTHMIFDYTDFRAMFMVGVPRKGTGEFGFAYDNHPYGGYDTQPFPDFYDGFPAGTSMLLKQVWQNVDRIRAGGVSWYLYLEDGTCT